MSDINAYAEPEEYMDELESPCDYGLEFCIDPQCRDIEGCVSCDYMCGVGEYAEKSTEPFIEIHWLFYMEA